MTNWTNFPDPYGACRLVVLLGLSAFLDTWLRARKSNVSPPIEELGGLEDCELTIATYEGANYKS